MIATVLIVVLALAIATIGRAALDPQHSYVRRCKEQAQKILACSSSCSAWPPLGKAGGTIMKRRLIML